MSSSTESAAVGRIKSSAASGRISNIEFVSQLAANRMSSILLPEHHYNVSSPVVQIYAEDTSEQQDITEGDIEEFATRLGIDLDKEPHFRYLVQEGLLAPLPPEWKPCRDLTKNQFYYFNIKTNETQWEHPLNAVYREKVFQMRQDHAMSRIQQTTLNKSSSGGPPKSLPPLKKMGLSRPPSSVSLGAMGAVAGRGGNGFGKKGRLDDHLTLTRVSESLGELSRDLEQYDQDSFSLSHNDENADTLPLPSSRMIKKPGSTLLLTGEGANFLKSSNKSSATAPLQPSTVLSSFEHDNVKVSFDKYDDDDDDDDDEYESIPKVEEGPSSSEPTKSILQAPSNFIRKGLQNVIDSQEWMLKPEIMTDEEKNLLAEISLPLKDKHGVKFSLDDNTELKFDPVESEASSPIQSQSHTNQPSKTETKSVSKSLKVSKKKKNTMFPTNSSDDNSHSHASVEDRNSEQKKKNKTSVSVKSNLDEGSGEKVGNNENLDKKKATLRQNMETELKKYQQVLESDRREREEQINKHTEMTLEEIRHEKEAFLKKARQEFEHQKIIELDKIKRDLELVVKTEVGKLKIIYDKELENRKSESKKQHNVAMSMLSQEFDLLDDDAKNTIYQQNLSETTLKLNSELKQHKESLRDEQRRQIQQMRDYHQTFIEKLKKELHSEEVRLQSEHKQKLADILETFNKETADLIQKLKEEQTSQLQTIMKEFDREKEAVETELKNGISSLRNDFNDLKCAVNSSSSAQTQNTAAGDDVKLKSPSKSTSTPRKSNPEVKILGEKYDQLEKKYGYLKKELRKITEAAAVRHANKQGTNKSVPASKSRNISKNISKSARNSEESDIHLLQCEISNNNSPVGSSLLEESESTTTTGYPSSYNNNNQNHNNDNDHDSVENGNVTPVDELLVEHNDKLAIALKSLDTLKQQILEIQKSRPNSAAVSNSGLIPVPIATSTPRTGGGNNSRKKNLRPITPPVPPPTAVSSTSVTTARKQNNNNNTNMNQNQRHNNTLKSSNHHQYKNTYEFSGRRLRPSKSTPELPGLIEAMDSDDQDSGHQIVQDAKEFIRSQKERFTTNTTTTTNPTQTQLTLQAIQNTYNDTRPTTFLNHHHHHLGEGGSGSGSIIHPFSEAESSGIGSMSFLHSGLMTSGGGGSDHLKSTEKKKISKDIEAICSSLSHLDEQMKLMWNVVNTNSPSPSNTADPLTQLQSSSYPEMPMPPSFQNYNQNQQQQPGNTTTTTAYLFHNLPPLAQLSPSNLLNSLDKELHAFKATKEQILSQFSHVNKNKGRSATDLMMLGSAAGGDQCSLQDKTKDLREWLEKF